MDSDARKGTSTAEENVSRDQQDMNQTGRSATIGQNSDQHQPTTASATAFVEKIAPGTPHTAVKEAQTPHTAAEATPTPHTITPHSHSHAQSTHPVGNPHRDCLPISFFGPLIPEEENLPERLLQVAALLPDLLQSANWAKEMIAALPSQFPTTIQLKKILRKRTKLTLTDVLLHFYAFFRGVHRCDDKQDTFVTRIKKMPVHIRNKCKISHIQSSILNVS